MNISVTLDENGMLPDAYGKYCAPADQRGRLCTRSFPFDVSDIPASARALAWIMLDWDSTPVCGFPWIHWCAQLCIEPGNTAAIHIADNVSNTGIAGLIQGFHSDAKSDPAHGSGYVGPCPPNADHVYTLHVVALDEPCGIEEPFWANELVNAARGHVLAEATIELPSRC